MKNNIKQNNMENINNAIILSKIFTIFLQKQNL